ncbi:MAG: Asp-tRNA(Asn)/Glu-tRNA(Gln) amidotransferase subunit GatB [Vulcanimicrobiaceae bacterium]
MSTAVVQRPDALTINGAPYEVVIGIECHVELKTETKMFCGCRNVFGAEPNTNVCPVCLGMPGALPVPNRRAIELLVKAGLAFDAEIPVFSKFDRKNYFYPDMPKDYQISQFDTPLTQGGVVPFWLPDGTQGSCRLTRIHLEEDTGKSSHASRDGRIANSTHSLVDFNRAGVPLMECVGEPDIRTSAQAVAYLEALKRTFVALDVSDVKMEEGSLRCDVNLSLRPAGQREYGTKAEIKNMNSFNSVARAIESEVARQAEVIASGGRVVQETRGWDEAAGTTHAMRNKEQAHDYRYFPDPDLPPIEFAPTDVARMRGELGTLPQARLDRMVREHGLSVVQAQQIVDKPGLADYYDAAVAGSGKPQATVNFVLGDLSRLANETGTTVAASGMTPQALAELVALVETNAINSKTAKDLLVRIWSAGGSPAALVRAEGLAQVSDAGAIDALVARIVASNEKTVADYRAGKTKVMGFLVGQVMKESRGKANPTLAEERLRAALGVAEGSP